MSRRRYCGSVVIVEFETGSPGEDMTFGPIEYRSKTGYMGLIWWRSNPYIADEWSWRWRGIGVIGNTRRFQVFAPFWQVASGTAILPSIWFLSRFKRARKGYCPTCFYDLTGNASGICPECGTPVPQAMGRGRTGPSKGRGHNERRRPLRKAIMPSLQSLNFDTTGFQLNHQDTKRKMWITGDGDGISLA